MRLVILVVVLVLAGVAWLVNRGTTSAGDLAVGDCFAAIDLQSVEVGRVDLRDCSERHEGEVFAVFESERLSARSSIQDCDAAVDPSAIDVTAVPPDVVVGAFAPSQDEWSDGDRTIVCWIFSETGFERPVLLLDR